MRLRGKGGGQEACFLACMMELAKKYGDHQHVAFIAKAYKRVMKKPKEMHRMLYGKLSNRLNR